MEARSSHMVVERSQVISYGEQRLLQGYAGELGRRAGCEGFVTFIEDASIPMLMVMFTLAVNGEPLTLGHILVTNADTGAQACTIRGPNRERLDGPDLFPNVVAALEALNPMLRDMADAARKVLKPTFRERVSRFFR